MLSNENEASTVETTMDSLINDYIDNFSYSISNLIADAKISSSDTDLEIFEDITLPVIVSMYCSPGLKFEAKQFKEDLIKCDVKIRNALKIYKALQELSKAAVKYDKSKTTTPTLAIIEPRSMTTPDVNLLLDDVDNASIDLGSLMQESSSLPADGDANVQREGEEYLTFLLRTESI